MFFIIFTLFIGILNASDQEGLNALCRNTLNTGGTALTYKELVEEVIANKYPAIKYACETFSNKKVTKARFTLINYRQLQAEIKSIPTNNLIIDGEFARHSAGRESGVPGEVDFYYAIYHLISAKATAFMKQNYKKELLTIEEEREPVFSPIQIHP